MTRMRKGILLAALQCVLSLAVGGKLLYDRATCPRVWVRTAPWDPSLPIRGRYLALALRPQSGEAFVERTAGERVLFFVPERQLPFERTAGVAGAQELWVEVTIPHHGPPRPIRLATKRDGRLEPILTN